jgi:hypothetical protein
MAVADKVLERRPGYRLALHAAQVINADLAQVATNELNPAEALRFAEREVQISESLLNLDPGNVVSINNMGVAHQGVGDALWAQGRVRDAIPPYLKSLDDYAKATAGGAGFFLIRGYDVAQTANKQAMVGDDAGAAAAIASGEPFLANLRRSEPQGSITLSIVEAMQETASAAAAYERDDLAGARRTARKGVQGLEATKPSGGIQEFQKYISLYVVYNIAGRTDYLLGDYAAAERSERAAMDARKHSPIEAIGDKRDMGELSTWLAMAIARQGREAEAAQTIGSVVKFQRELAATNHGDRWQDVELAAALYAQALTDKTRSAALLNEAAAKLDSLPATMRSMHDVRQWRERIRAAERDSRGILRQAPR